MFTQIYVILRKLDPAYSKISSHNLPYYPIIRLALDESGLLADPVLEEEDASAGGQVPSDAPVVAPIMDAAGARADAEQMPNLLVYIYIYMCVYTPPPLFKNSQPPA